MAIHKHCYISLKRTQQGGPRRRKTVRQLLIEDKAALSFVQELFGTLADDIAAA